MTIFLSLILTAVTFAFVFFPFFKHKVQVAGADEDEKLEELRSERDTTYSMLKELEFDYQSGILTEDDYKELEARYKRKAISTLRDIDSTARGDATEDEPDEIEKQVQQLRKSKGKPSGRTSQAMTKKFCSQCREEVNEKDKFCASCGANLGSGGGGG